MPKPLGDAALDFPSARRNGAPILQVLKANLGSRAADVLEIASGSGQHAVHFCATMPNVRWWPTDLNPDHINSIKAWRSFGNVNGNINAPQLLDVCKADWLDGAARRSWPQQFDAMVNINMIHISPFAATKGLMRGAGKYLRPGGTLFLYGPFKIDGAHTAPSNADFDQSLQARNPQWGVRDKSEVEAVAGAQGLTLRTSTAMPANNYCLTFERV
jgi:SAM-dependent methyltransferase